MAHVSRNEPAMGTAMRASTVPEGTFRAVVEAAIRAPSLHNSQPWRLRQRDGAVEICADPARRLPVADPTGWGVRIACGAAAFNAQLALAVAGCPAESRLRPEPSDPELMVRLVPVAARPATPLERRLYEAIPRRHSNRAPFRPEPVPADARTQLVTAARAEGAWLELIIGLVPVGAVAEVARAAGRVLDRDPAYRAELAAWTRAEDGAADGVPASAGGPSPEPHDLLPGRPFGTAARAPGRDFEEQPLIGVLGTATDSPNDQLTAGHALQRALLTLTCAGLAASMLSQPIEVAAAREQLRLALGRYGVPQMVLRIGYGTPAFATPRRAAAEVIDA